MSIHQVLFLSTFIIIFIIGFSNNNLKEIFAVKYQNIGFNINYKEDIYLNSGYSDKPIGTEQYNYNENKFGILSVEIDAMTVLNNLIVEIKFMELSEHNSKYAAKRLMLSSLNTINKVINDGNIHNDVVICDRMVNSFNNDLKKYFMSGIINQKNKEKIEEQILLFRDLICEEGFK